MILDAIYEKVKGHRITTDSRKVCEGDIFVALRGENFDGNDYVEAALKSGASYAIAEKSPSRARSVESSGKAKSLEVSGSGSKDGNVNNSGSSSEAKDSACSGANVSGSKNSGSGILDERIILVENSLETLQKLASLHRHKLGIPILGITGTNGKTTTKELCHAVVAKKYRTVATEGNLNNHIGVPLTLLSMDETTEFGIVEMGANHPGEIATLCEIADPDYGLITNIGEGHIEGFGTKENIIETKSALYRHIAAKRGTLFVNSDDPLLMRLSSGIERKTYGEKGDTAVGKIAQSIPYLVADIDSPHGHIYFKTKLVGGYNFDNLMAATAVGLSLGIDIEKIKEGVEEYRPGNMRSQLIEHPDNTIILDAYNANPSSMRVSIENFAQIAGDKKVVILGKMGELGHREESAHRELVELVAGGNFERVILIGEPFKPHLPLCKNAEWFESTETLMEALTKMKLKNCLIFVKGSRTNRLERIVEFI